MGRYLCSRIAQAALTLVGISLLVFVLMHVIGGDPARLVLGPRAPESAVLALRTRLGLDRSLPAQYLSFLGGALHGAFGTSIDEGLPVGPIIMARAGATALLVTYALAVGLVVAVPVGVVAAVRRNGPIDHATRLISTVTWAMPAFWLGLLLVLVFSVDLKIFPVAGYGNTFSQHLVSLTLPAVTVGLGISPVVIRIVRSSMSETLTSEFVEASRARGLPEWRVLVRHALRNSLLAPLTVIGVFAGWLITLDVTVENVFALPGLGTLLVQSVTNRDFPTVQALALVLGAAVVVLNLMTDLLYVAVDPRVRL